MDRGMLEIALREGVPFEVETTGGSKLVVSDVRDAALRSTYLMTFDAKDCPHMIPYQMISKLHYLGKTA